MTTYVILQFHKKQIQREVKRKIIAGIDREDLVLFKFIEKETQPQLNSDSKEFKYKGKIYDIVETHIIGDTTYCWAWGDLEETEIEEQLDKFVSFSLDNNPKNQENQKRLHKFLESLYFSGTKRKLSLIFKEFKNKCLFEQKFHQLVSYSPPVPPPKI